MRCARGTDVDESRVDTSAVWNDAQPRKQRRNASRQREEATKGVCGIGGERCSGQVESGKRDVWRVMWGPHVHRDIDNLCLPPAPVSNLLGVCHLYGRFFRVGRLI
ncbi:hypothetical protein GQ55_3G069500 [Panicum hallii var. hallii]|uniref:Uncharacterized protein n=1 Tax=Panicum hallii var. hallii TaxID=1504633 RepID=A0A2T7E6K8_9POAL|nr:hypothetical protein GQ55_3G069500 [Panicum hallii var. hallii]